MWGNYVWVDAFPVIFAIEQLHPLSDWVRTDTIFEIVFDQLVKNESTTIETFLEKEYELERLIEAFNLSELRLREALSQQIFFVEMILIDYLFKLLPPYQQDRSGKIPRLFFDEYLSRMRFCAWKGKHSVLIDLTRIIPYRS